MRKLLLGSLFLLFASIGGCQNQVKNSTYNEGISVSFIVIDSSGLEKTEFEADEPIYFYAFVSNNTGKTLEYLYYPFERKNLIHFDVSEKGTNGLEYILIGGSPPSSWKMSNLLDGEKIVTKEKYDKTLPPGEYIVDARCQFTFKDKTYHFESKIRKNFIVLP